MIDKLRILVAKEAVRAVIQWSVSLIWIVAVLILWTFADPAWHLVEVIGAAFWSCGIGATTASIIWRRRLDHTRRLHDRLVGDYQRRFEEATRFERFRVVLDNGLVLIRSPNGRTIVVANPHEMRQQLTDVINARTIQNKAANIAKSQG